MSISIVNTINEEQMEKTLKKLWKIESIFKKNNEDEFIF